MCVYDLLQFPVTAINIAEYLVLVNRYICAIDRTIIKSVPRASTAMNTPSTTASQACSLRNILFILSPVIYQIVMLQTVIHLYYAM